MKIASSLLVVALAMISTADAAYGSYSSAAPMSSYGSAKPASGSYPAKPASCKGNCCDMPDKQFAALISKQPAEVLALAKGAGITLTSCAGTATYCLNPAVMAGAKAMGLDTVMLKACPKTCKAMSKACPKLACICPKVTTAAPAGKVTTAQLKAMTKVVKTQMTLKSFATVASFDAKAQKGVANGAAKTLKVDPLQVTIENIKAATRRLGHGAQRRLASKGITFDILIRVSNAADAAAMTTKVKAAKANPATLKRLVENMNSAMKTAGSSVVIAPGALAVGTPATVAAEVYVDPTATATAAPTAGPTAKTTPALSAANSQTYSMAASVLCMVLFTFGQTF